MEIPRPAPYTFKMLLSAVKKRWLVAPLAALFLIFSGGAAVAPDCHIATSEKIENQSLVTYSHSSASHTHSHGSATTLPSSLTEPLLALGGSISNEVCFIVGFIVLLLLRFARGAKPDFTFIRMARSLAVLPQLVTRRVNNLNLTHLQLGVIRI